MKIEKAVAEVDAQDSVESKSKKRKRNHFWDHPSSQALIELRDEKIISSRIYKSRSAELAIKFKIIQEGDAIVEQVDGMNVSI